MLLVDAVHEAGPLIPRPAPVVEEAINDASILKHDVVHVSVFLEEEEEKRKFNSRVSSGLAKKKTTSDRERTCLFSVMALGWHLVQIPSGQGGWPSQPDLILQLMFSRAANFPLREAKAALEPDRRIVCISHRLD